MKDLVIPFPKSIRARWYLLAERDGKSVSEICKIFGMSRKTYYKWHKHDFWTNNRYHPRKPHPNLKLTSNVKQFIESNKKITNYGPLKMKLLVKRKLGLDISTTLIYRYYKKRMLIRKPQRRLPWFKPIKHRLTINHPGVGIQVDVKYVYGNDGRRRFQFSFLDVYTKKYYLHIFDTKESKNAVIAHKYANRYFGFNIISVQTDNGSEFRGDYHRWLGENDIIHYFIPKSSPNWNPYVERIHKTIDDEYYQNPQRVWNKPEEWLNFYNFERIHLSLNGLTPQEMLEKCNP